MIVPTFYAIVVDPLFICTASVCWNAEPNRCQFAFGHTGVRLHFGRVPGPISRLLWATFTSQRTKFVTFPSPHLGPGGDETYALVLQEQLPPTSWENIRRGVVDLCCLINFQVFCASFSVMTSSSLDGLICFHTLPFSQKDLSDFSFLPFFFPQAAMDELHFVVSQHAYP